MQKARHARKILVFWADVHKRFFDSQRLEIFDETPQDFQFYTQFKKFLKQQKISCTDGHTCLQVECRLCNRDQTQLPNMPVATAYVNKRTGAFICPNCDIKEKLKIAMDVYAKSKPHFNEQKKNYESLFPTNLIAVSQSQCEALGIQNLAVKDFQQLEAKYDAESNLICFPLKNAAKVTVGKINFNLNEKTEGRTIPDQHCSGVLTYGAVNKIKKAVLVTNIMDFLTLVAQRLDTHCIICLPYGLKALPQDCLPSLEHFNELVFWFKFDSTGWDTATTFATKMDEKRCLLIRPTDTAPSPSEAYRKRLNLKHIIHKAYPVRHKSITTFSALRNDILSDLQNIEKVQGVKWKRFPILNKLLKGHRRGELTIITGPTGSGKTTFMSEYSLDLALQGISTLWGSFEIRNTRLAATLLRQFVGYSLHNKLNEFDYWASAFEKYPVFFMTFHGQQSLKVVMEAIEHAHYVHDISHVIIDNLQFMMGHSTQRTDKFWEQDAIISTFRGFATKHNVHVTLVMHPRKERTEEDLTTSSVFGTAKATQEADNVLIIQDKRLTSLRGKRYLQVVKNRYSGDLGIMPLDFNKESLSYAIKKKKEKEQTDN